MSRPDRHAYEFGPFRLSPAEGHLLREGNPVTLTPKAFEALVLLVERQGHLIEKEELMKSLWPDTFVEEANLAHHVWRLRKALEDSKEVAQYIETVPKRGYRFIAPVKIIENSTPALVVEEHTVTRVVAERETEDSLDAVSSSAIVIGSRSRISITTGTIVIAACLLVLVAAFAYVRFGIKGTTTPDGAGAIRTLAVLPFKPLTPDNSDASLELGMADALITRLSNLKELTVRPTSAVIKYTAPNSDLAGIGHELNVQTVLDGRVQRAGDRMRVTVQLVRTADGKPLWAEQFDEKSADIFALEDSLSQKVARALALQLTVAETSRIQQHYTNNIEAYHAYLRGRYQMNQAAAGALQAEGSFEEAIQKDPRFALAYAGLADAHSALAFMGLGSGTPGEELMKAKDAALKALELDDSLAEAHNSLANLLFSNEWKWTEAEREFKRAIELNPNLAEAHHWYSEYLQAMTRSDEALAEIKRAQELDPLSLTINFHYGLCLFGMGRHEEALAQFRRTLDIDPTTGGQGSHWGIAMVYQRRGMYDEAIRELEEARRLDPRPSWRLTGDAEAYALAGRRTEALAMLAQILEARKHQYVSPFAIGQIYAALGDKDQAFVWMNKAIDEREVIVVYLRAMGLSEPSLSSLRDDPRFQLLLQRVGLSFQG